MLFMNDIELFENWFKSTKWFTGDNCTPKYKTYRSMLQAWQASAQREGYKLVPVEINNEIESAMFSSVARGEMPCDIYKAMIGARESNG